MAEQSVETWYDRELIVFDFLTADLPKTFLEVLEDPDIEVMQCTGIKDKNGNLVFFNDIVNCSEGCPHRIIWQHDFFGMPKVYLEGLYDGYSWTGEEEIIGNVYQSPHLLNA